MNKQTMIKVYREFSAHDAYVFGFVYKKELYISKVDEIKPRMVAVERASTQNGGQPKLQLRLKNQHMEQLIRKGAEKIGTMADLPLDRYSNKGVALECLISERNGIEFRGKDNIGFWVEGDLTINGISYQIKFNGAQIVSEGTLHTLKRFQKLGLELPKSINRGTNGKLDKIEAERKNAA